MGYPGKTNRPGRFITRDGRYRNLLEDFLSIGAWEGGANPWGLLQGMDNSPATGNSFDGTGKGKVSFQTIAANTPMYLETNASDQFIAGNAGSNPSSRPYWKHVFRATNNVANVRFFTGFDVGSAATAGTSDSLTGDAVGFHIAQATDAQEIHAISRNGVNETRVGTGITIGTGWRIYVVDWFKWNAVLMRILDLDLNVLYEEIRTVDLPSGVTDFRAMTYTTPTNATSTLIYHKSIFCAIR